MRIAICDDNKYELLQICQLVNEYTCSSSFEEKIEVFSFESSMQLLSKVESSGHFDIYLLDIIAPDMNGIELAAKIRSSNQVAKIIFLTSSTEFAVDSYSVDAFNYLIKPIQKDKLFSVLEKACHNISNDLQQYIVLKTQTGLFKVFLHQLVYLEVIGRTLYFHQKDGVTLESSSTLSQIEIILLRDKRFIKPHRSYIINLDFVKHLSQDGFTTTSGFFVPVSRNAFKDVKKAYINHSFQLEDR